VTRLGHTLNEMLAELQEALDRERRFVDDASHELRTPLTLLTSRIQLARRRDRSVAEHERVLDELSVDVTRLAELADRLLDADREAAYAGGGSDLAAVAGDVVARWRATGPVHAGAVAVHLPGDAVAVGMDAGALERVVTNLLGNATTHGAAPVEVTVRATDRRGLLTVADAGPGMPADLLARATHRFTRADEARSRPGAGLGLSIVEQLVTAAGGELRLCSGGHHSSVGVATEVPCRHDGRMTVTVVLPTVGEPVAGLPR
jgi:signal transduction histidine kinase